LPLYKLLKKADKFIWDDATHTVLQHRREYSPLHPSWWHQWSRSLCSSTWQLPTIVNIVIIVERKEEGYEYRVQRHVYYISKVLTESKQYYPYFQKLAYGVLLGSRKLRHYFQEHLMIVVSTAPLLTIINNSDATGRVAKWGIELSAFDINYKVRDAIKSQVLTNFFVDWTEAPEGTPMPE
jgi:hypothetical protein